MRLQRFVAIVLCVAYTAAVQPSVRAGAARAQGPGAQQSAPSPILTGLVLRADGQSGVANQRVRLRNVDRGTVAGDMVTDNGGAFSFPLPEPGTYVVEAVNPAGAVLAVSSAISSTASPLSTNIVLPSNDPPPGAFWTSTAMLVLLAAAGAGALAAVVGGGGGAAPAPVSPEQ